MYLSVFIRISVLLLLPIGGYTQVLYQNTEQGMTVEQVRAKLPHLQINPRPLQLSDGSQDLLTLPGIEIAAHQFVGQFYFLDNKLTSEQLSLQPGVSFSEAVGVFNVMLELLRAKYGMEVTHTERKGLLGFLLSEWRSGNTRITLSAVNADESDKNAILTLSFSVFADVH